MAFVEVGKIYTTGVMYVAECWWPAGVTLSDVVLSDDGRWFGRMLAYSTRTGPSKPYLPA